MKYDVFISYSRKDYVDEQKNVIDGNIVSKIKDLLTANGYTYWLDEEGISAGDQFSGIITEAILNSEIFLFLSSKNSNASKWTIHEIAVAKMLGKKTIPFRVDNTLYDTSVMMYLATLDYIDYDKNQNKAFNALLVALNRHMTKLKEEEQRKLQEEQRKLKAKEEAEARIKAEEEKKKRISAIDMEILNLEYKIDETAKEKETIQANIKSLKEKIGEYLNDINSIEESIKSHNHSIIILKKEKDSLLGISVAEQLNEEDEYGESKEVFSPVTRFYRTITDVLTSPFNGKRSRFWYFLLILIFLLLVIALCYKLGFVDYIAKETNILRIIRQIRRFFSF
jgi:hypothetical protein